MCSHNSLMTMYLNSFYFILNFDRKYGDYDDICSDTFELLIVVSWPNS